MTLAVVFQSSHLSTVNLVRLLLLLLSATSNYSHLPSSPPIPPQIGLLVCVTGIALHILRKAQGVEKKPKKQEGSGAAGGQRDSLLSSCSSDSEVEVFHTTGSDGKTRASSLSPSPYLQVGSKLETRLFSKNKKIIKFRPSNLRNIANGQRSGTPS